MKKRSLWSALALMLTLLAGCAVSDGTAAGGGAATGDGHSLRFMTVYPANTTDPQVVQSSFILNSGAVETLVGLDPKSLELAPALAQSWTATDPTTWTFTIRDGVTFHNGKPVDAEAVRKSIARVIEVNPGAAKLLPIASMNASGQTLQIHTSAPAPGLPSEFVHFNTVIVDTDADGTLPIGTGPFAFEAFDIRGEARLSRYDGYWGGPAKLAHVTMTANQDANARLLALQSGEADLIYRPSTESLDALRGDSRMRVESVPGTRVYHLLYNCDGPNATLWANEEFRRGIDALIDRDAITKTVLSGEGQSTDSPFPTGRIITPPAGPAREHGTEVALAHFRAAGLDVSGGRVTRGGAPLAMNIVTYVARPELPGIAQVVENAASQVGISLSIVTADNIDEHLDKNRSGWDLATYSVNTITRGDGSYFINGSLSPGGAQNHGHLDVAALNTLNSRFNATSGVGPRAQVAKQIGSMVRDDYLNAYIVSPNETAAYDTSVTGWTTPPNEFEFPMITKDLDRG